ncbi:MAG TPA: serine/threonine-protein kinase [Gemmatimonadaceae bacterium]|nr:serine/threonine-protein kinase [Gemmatimonadaceae bacterium]
MSGPPGVTSEQFAGRYTIERELGRGATATVYMARDPERGRTVAIKLLRQELAASTAAKQFVREIRRTSGLQHPRIVPVLDAGEHGGQLYCVLPYMDGGTLRHRLVREKQLPVTDAVAIARAVAEALDYAHQHGLIHRDVKPENILFTAGEACLADFGIARALEKSAGDTSTSRGIVRGTMAYMSPEQASGEHEYDGRSDVFALGCVLYEMLAGVPAFIGPTPEAALAQRFAHPPRDVRIYRPTIPDELEAVIRKSLQFAPADRYRSAGAMAAALRQVEIAIETTSSAQRLASARQWRRRDRRLLVLAGVGGLVVIGGIVLGTRDRQGVGAFPDAPPDTTRLVVLPLEHVGESEDRRLDDDLLHDALSSWRGIGVVDRFQVADALARRAPNRSHGTLSAVATSLGAGRYVRGQVRSSGDSLLAYAAVYDVTSPNALHQASVGVPRDAVRAAARYARLAAALLLRVSPADVAADDLGTPRSVPAMQSFGRGQLALDGWDLAAADSAFEAAIAFDPDYTRAYLWLAQVRAWRGMRVAAWRSVAERALAGASELPEREGRLAEAAALLANQRFVEACEVYDELRQQNDRDFAAWFGLGECRRMDPVVVADASSPSGWRFRSSYHRAIEAYTRAFEVLPTVHRGYERGVFDRVRTLLLLTELKPGWTLPDSAPFLARAAWMSDTLALIPYPAHLVYAGGPDVLPPGFAEARARQRAVFRRIASGWSAAYPTSAGAKRAVALSLELIGDRSAIDSLRLARRLTTDRLRRAELAAAEVMLLVKFSVPDDPAGLQAARALADSLLSSPGPVSRAEAVALAPLASLLGRCAMAEQLARAAASAEGWLNIPGHHVADAQALLARTSLGCERGPTTPGLSALAATLARDLTGARERRQAEIVLLFRPALATAELDSALLDRLAEASGHQLLRAASAASRGDRGGVRSALTAFAAGWSEAAGPVTPDMAYPGARLWVSIGDTAAAIAWLDRTLGALRDFDPGVLTDPATVAALVRAIVLRAELSGGVGDTVSARRWGSAAVALWTEADAELKASSGGGSPFSRF